VAGKRRARASGTPRAEKDPQRDQAKPTPAVQNALQIETRHHRRHRGDAGIGQKVGHREPPRRNLSRGDRIHGPKEYPSRARVKRDADAVPIAAARPGPEPPRTNYRHRLSYINMTRIRALHACSTTIDAGAASLPPALVEEVVDLARGLGADPGHLGEIGQRRALDRLERTEMVEQRAFAGRADAGDFLQSRLANIAAAPEAVRADGETMRLVA